MGNQESIVNDKYEVKKIYKDNTKNNSRNDPRIDPRIDPRNSIHNNTRNKTKRENNVRADIESERYNHFTYNDGYNSHNNKQNYIQNELYYDYSNNINEQNTFKNKKSERNSIGSALMERNMINDLYSNQKSTKSNIIFDYPSNSNNELVEPKKNFDNIKFTPYNFNDEVNKFKKNINDERNDFNIKEKERRSRFEKMEKEKENYLNEQIKKFESEYNPWEILGLKYKDLNIDNIKKAYKKNALKYHPDRAGDAYKDKFQLITQSYVYLLNKADENNELDNKINRKVEKMDYEDNINEKKENIYVSKDKFDINQFNKIFEQYKIPSVHDKGYGNLKDEKIEKDDEIFGQNFNKDVFNSHFEKKKSKKQSNELIEYQEPMALDSLKYNTADYLGTDDVDDFGAINNSGGLSYTDYKKAHIDETMLIDASKVKYKTYNSVDHLENERSRISYQASPEDRQRYEYMERKRMEDDNRRIQKQKEYDEYIESHYNKLNRKLIVHK